MFTPSAHLLFGRCGEGLRAEIFLQLVDGSGRRTRDGKRDPYVHRFDPEGARGGSPQDQSVEGRQVRHGGDRPGVEGGKLLEEETARLPGGVGGGSVQHTTVMERNTACPYRDRNRGPG